MARYYNYTIFGSTYGSGAYSSCDYSGTSSTCSTSGGGSGSTGTGTGNGSLANTGVAIVGVVSLACFLIAMAFIVKFWRRKRASQPVMQEGSVGREDEQDHSLDDQYEK